MDIKGTIHYIDIHPHPEYPNSFIVTLPFPDKRVFSCLGDGSMAFSHEGSTDQSNTCQVNGLVATFQNPNNTFWDFALLKVDALWP